MGLKLGKVLKKTVGSVLKRAPALVGGFLTGGPMGAGLAMLTKPGGFAPGEVGAGIPSIQEFTGVGPFMQRQFAAPVAQRNGGLAVPVAGAMPAIVGGMSRAVIGAIVRLAGALGIGVTAANIGRVGVRLWRSVNAMARRHPGVSILAFLTGLGLAAEEAAEFLFWGQTKARRRRGRGISARDIRICRRTIRKLAVFRRDLGSLGPPGRRAAAHHHHPRGGVV